MREAILQRQVVMLGGAALCTLLPHLAYLPRWLWPLDLALLALAVARLWWQRRPPPRLLLYPFTLAVVAGIGWNYHHFFGRAPGTATLATMLVLKLLETRDRRDARVALFLSFFLQLAVFFTTQSIPVAMTALVGTAFSVAALLALAAPAQAYRQLARTTALLMLQSLPLMLVLFVLFPRVQGPLWGMPADARTGLTGLSDSMSPGAFNELIASDEIALHARFAGPPPPPGQRYWRGPVLTLFDGLTWRRFPAHHEQAPVYAVSGPAYAYRLSIEAHGKPWLLALDYPGPADDARLRFDSDFTLSDSQPVNQRRDVDLVSYPETVPSQEEHSGVLAAARQLPGTGNPRTRALGSELAARYASAAARADAALAYFRRAGLHYTLNPGALEGDTVDGFLFDSKRGFCEHFSSAFVFLMRAAGLPARVVTGYQGGRYDAATGTITVRQSDAHAWAEVWLHGRGWIRYDPTATAVPLRITEGLAEALPQTELPLMMQSRMRWLLSLRNQWESLNNRWNQWVVGYDPRQQRDLFAGLGLPDVDWKTLGRLLAVTVSLFLLLLFAWGVRERVQRPAIQQAWDRFCAKLAAAGLPRRPWEGPLDYASRVAARFPQHAAPARDICLLYARQRYGKDSGPAALADLRQRIRRFKVP